jgi:hypothetical protein
LLVANFLRPRAGDARNLLAANLGRPSADAIGDRLVANFVRVVANGVGLFVARRAGNLTANRVRNLAVLHFGLVTRAALLLIDGLFDPNAAAAGRRRALHFDDAAATGVIHAAASAGVIFPVTRIALALIHHGTRNRFGHGLPFAAIHRNHLLLGDRLAHRVANVFVARLLLSLVRRAANVAVAGRVAGLADRVAHISVARLLAQVAGRDADLLVARLEARLADREAAVFVARLKDELRVAVRNLFANVIVNRLAARVALLFPNSLVDRLVRRAGRSWARHWCRAAGRCRAAGFCRAHIAGRRTRCRRATGVASEEAGGGAVTRMGQRQRDYDRNPSCVFHCFALVPPSNPTAC